MGGELITFSVCDQLLASKVISKPFIIYDGHWSGISQNTDQSQDSTVKFSAAQLNGSESSEH